MNPPQYSSDGDPVPKAQATSSDRGRDMIGHVSPFDRPHVK
jgi:hypothetical protein